MTKDLLTMRIKCLQCGVSGSVSNALIGKRVRCPKCEKVFLLTEENSPPLLKKAPQKDPSIGEVSGCTCDFDLSHQGITTHKGISRIDQTEKRTHGWYARVRFKGKSHPKFFSDRKFGDKNASLLAAIKWRDETETTLGIVRTDNYTETAAAKVILATQNSAIKDPINETPRYITEPGLRKELTEENSPPLLEKDPQKDPSIGEVSGCTSDFDLGHQGITTHKGISRIDQTEKRTHGWYARVRFKGKSHPKFFSDGKFGDKNVSLHAAIKWRDETETTLGIVRIDRQVLKKCESLTGEVGVRFNYKLGRYEVSWVTAEGKQGKTSVSIRKYGKNNALEIAQKIRKEKEAERLSHSNYKQPFQNSLPSEQPLEPSYKDESVDHGQKLMAISDDAPTSITIRKKVRGKIEL